MRFNGGELDPNFLDEKQVSIIKKIKSVVQKEDLSYVCLKIIAYLVSNPEQRKITIGGLKSSLNLNQEYNNSIISASYLLSSQSFNIFSVKYRLYDESLTTQIGEYNSQDFLEAVQNELLIDDEGNEIANFQDYSFPYFIKLDSEEWNVR